MSTVHESIFRGDDFLRPIVFSRPLRLVEPTSWVSHIPFAFWLIDALRPRVVVELGTQAGNSFSAMAQAVQQLELDTACYAVDTWEGDPHTGGYGEDVFTEWSSFHDLHFGAFSRLVRSTFDDALPKFLDGSIDLLHIDGFHTYEATRHDFETWRRKLSPRSVVILHDVNVRERDFGVWKLWDELAREYPCFSFLHGHGLGVLGYGTDLPTDVRHLLQVSDTGEAFVVRQFFGTLGEALLRQPREAALVQRESDQRAEVTAARAEREALTAANMALTAELETLRAAAADAVAGREAMTTEGATASARLASTRVELEAARSELDALRGAVSQALAGLSEWTEHEASRSGTPAAGGRRASGDQLEGIRLGFERARQRVKELEDAAVRHNELVRKAEEGARLAVALSLRVRHSRWWRATGALRQAAAVGREVSRRARFWKPTPPVHSLPLLASLRPSLRHQLQLVSGSRLFDAGFYLRDLTRVAADATVAAAWDEPALHYLLVGGFHGVNPHPLFDSAFYLERHADVRSSGMNPLLHYLHSGWREGRDPHPLFDSAFYLREHPDIAAAKVNPLVHFATLGGHEGRDPNPWFDSSFYLDADPGLRGTGENPLVHYLRIGALEGRPTSALFDTRFYLRSSADVLQAGLNPLVHYVIAGRLEGRRAVPTVPVSAAGDIQASGTAYDWVRARARESEAGRVQGLRVTAPALIEVKERELAERARDIRLSFEESPRVSLVIPIVNGIKLTLECLLSIVRSTTDVPFEVVIVDNGSSDRSRELLSSIEHLTYVRHDENLGFGPACNAGAAAARGQYLVFLNNDAQVQPHWLSALLEAFSRSDRVGAVGPKVLFPDGRLQDAGSVINTDCTTSLLGVFDDPDLPQFNSRREVDYVSGVCLLIEADLFRALGGFDPAFAPAYCEDVDLCLRLRGQGKRIVYEPEAVIAHHLSATSSELGASFKMATVVRHQQELSHRHQVQIDGLDRTRVIAFYLPQFHPVLENDVWWGKGFTEWRNVTRARPVFEGHYQPRLAGDLGFYDLRLRETYLEQTALAERYGVDGFCFYYYWFGGRRLLERPLERLLEDRTLTFPFCVCWANENWTRRWDGQDHEILMAQSYREEDDLAVIDDLSRYMRHPAYIRVDGRPLLLIYHASRFPDIRRTIDRWRTECRRQDVGEIYLAMVETFELRWSGASAADWGFDGIVEFPPHQGGTHPIEVASVDPEFKGRIFSYDRTAVHYMTRPLPNYRLFRTVMPGWDNTARRPKDSMIFSGSTPGAYQAWLEHILRQTREQRSGDEQLVFVNAWNEWAEAAYLEPDLAWGHAYLEATRDARLNARLRLCPE